MLITYILVNGIKFRRTNTEIMILICNLINGQFTLILKLTTQNWFCKHTFFCCLQLTRERIQIVCWYRLKHRYVDSIRINK